ncbi:uncharacterized protein PHACADRAFT_183921 [Phanerochaete carnosa HHB-10118-sp]|uniref:F-box domain-containing protein n=1 Tax=Phanerochaete carnosa (strain HHB-10118-sp) TaxID=650164 RepID=K5W7X9_PHACS|nr:uncharacterized protein PHACADRAFT_183921 [Phanerochaete carnosa HHB-10118-sp]EKM55079.1 hypothetical protein PHACADRAFT_183921 [Phanerochaete carnosa HHB-10118-sp]
MACRMPQELVDIVLESLSDNEASLKNCSLVSREWSISSSSHLFRRFRWPPCVSTWKISNEICESALERDSGFTFLLGLLSSSTRLRDSICELYLCCHRFGCTSSYNLDVSLFSTLPRILAILPRLRVLELNAWPVSPRKSLAHMRFEQQQAYAIEELRIICNFNIIPVLLSPFCRISKLTITWRELGVEEAQPFRPDTPIEVRSITINGLEEAILLLLQGGLDLTAVRNLTLSSPPKVSKPVLGSIIMFMSSIESLGYEQVDPSAAPFDAQVGGGLFALAVEPRDFIDEEYEDAIDRDGVDASRVGRDIDGGAAVTGGYSRAVAEWKGDDEEIEGGSIEYSDWEHILRDLRILVTDVTENITINLRVNEAYTIDDFSEPDDIQDITRSLRKAFSLLDWAGLQAVTRRCSVLKSLRFAIAYEGFIRPGECAGILLKVIKKSLASDVVSKSSKDCPLRHLFGYFCPISPSVTSPEVFTAIQCIRNHHIEVTGHFYPCTPQPRDVRDVPLIP